jgi:hypothetical protein
MGLSNPYYRWRYSSRPLVVMYALRYCNRLQ